MNSPASPFSPIRTTRPRSTRPRAPCKRKRFRFADAHPVVVPIPLFEDDDDFVIELEINGAFSRPVSPIRPLDLDQFADLGGLHEDQL